MTWALKTRMTMMRTVCTFAAAVVCTAANSSPPDTFKKIDFEMTGTVFDADTKQPIEGAYVVASYKIQRAGLAAVANFCVKTKGMYTGKDGKYHFPVERLDGRSPFSTNAIKPGYFWKTSRYPDEEEWKRQDITTYSARDIYLKKQDREDPSWHFSNLEELCHEAPTREAAAAATQFLKIKLDELTNYRASEQQRSGLKALIQTFEALPISIPDK